MRIEQFWGMSSSCQPCGGIAGGKRTSDARQIRLSGFLQNLLIANPGLVNQLKRSYLSSPTQLCQLPLLKSRAQVTQDIRPVPATTTYSTQHFTPQTQVALVLAWWRLDMGRKGEAILSALISQAVYVDLWYLNSGSFLMAFWCFIVYQLSHYCTK